MRAGAMVATRHPICDGALILEPLTLERWGLLVATDNALVSGQPITFLDLVNFAWVLHRDFDQFARGPKAQLTRTLYDWLHPRHPHLTTALRLWACHPRLRWLERFTGPDYAARHRELVDLFRAIIVEAWADMPTPTGKDRAGSGVDISPCAFEAEVCRVFAPWSPGEVRRMPLATLAEHLRAAIADTKGRHDLSLVTAEESQIWQDYLADPLGRKTQKSNPQTPTL